MSDYSQKYENIDDQLLRAAKQEGVGLDHNELLHQQLQQQLQQHQHQLQLQQQGLSHQSHQHQQHQTFNDDNEYNIQIPEPIIGAKLKIYPVQENTITAEGNLITKPYPEQTFHDRKDLNGFISEFGRDNGFGVVIAHSNKKAIYYTCELGGRYRDKKNKKGGNTPNSSQFTNDSYLMDPNTKTKKLRCPFAMTASYKKNSSNWVLKVTCNEHNHPQLDPLANHPMLRKRTSELNLMIIDLYKLGTKPSHIESKIKEQYPDILIKREDIYNEIRGYKRKLKKDTGFVSPDSRFSKRATAHSFHQVGLDEEEDVDGIGNNPNLYPQRNDVDIESLQHVAAATVLNGQNGLDEQYHTDQTLQGVHGSGGHGSDQISMDNIDSRLVGE